MVYISGRTRVVENISCWRNDGHGAIYRPERSCYSSVKAFLRAAIYVRHVKLATSLTFFSTSTRNVPGSTLLLLEWPTWYLKSSEDPIHVMYGFNQTFSVTGKTCIPFHARHINTMLLEGSHSSDEHSFWLLWRLYHTHLIEYQEYLPWLYSEASTSLGATAVQCMHNKVLYREWSGRREAIQWNVTHFIGVTASKVINNELVCIFQRNW